MIDHHHYDALIKEEGRVWGALEADLANIMRPDWQAMQHLPHNVLLHAKHINALLSRIRPGWQVLEIGCGTGWLSLEMARRGAHVEGIDVAETSIQIARQYADDYPSAGSIDYAVADINHKTLEPAHYDLIVAQGVLHHLVELPTVLDQFRAALKPSGILYVSDILDTPRANTLIAGGFMMVLPTHLSYREKLSHLFRLRRSVLGHMRDSIEAKGLSPFEGLGRQHHPLDLIKDKFMIERIWHESAFTGYLIAQLRLSDRWVIRSGRIINWLDKALVRLKLLQGLNYVLIASLRHNQ